MPVPHAEVAASWEHFPHGSDIGIRGFGATLECALEQAALALTAILVEPECLADIEQVEITCANRGGDRVLYDWLNAIIYEMATRRMLFGHYQVSIDRERLSGLLWGERLDPLRHAPAVEPKGATFTELAVKRLSDGRWMAQCVIDV